MFFRRKRKDNFEDEFEEEKIEEEKQGEDSKTEGLDLKSTLEEIAEKTGSEDLHSEKENLEKEIEELKKERESVKNDIVTLSKQLNRMMGIKKVLEEKLKDMKDAIS